MEEIWKDVVGYEECYSVSNMGRIKSLVRTKSYFNGKGIMKRTFDSKILQPQKRGNYLKVYLVNRIGESKQLSVHRVVAIAFIKNESNKPQVNHIDGVKYNNRATNLEWVTAKENLYHAIQNGLTLSGSSKPNSKLIESDIYKIKNLRLSGLTYKEIGSVFNVSRQCISKVVRGITYSNDSSSKNR